MAKRRFKYTNCPNCDYSFKDIDNYCPNCGQKNHTLKLPVRHFLFELVEGYFHLDSKIINTLRDMFLKPGLISLNYNLGKRARYVSPIRFYIFVSFIFFFLLSFQKPYINTNPKQNQNSKGLNVFFSIPEVDALTDTIDLERLSQFSKLNNTIIDHYLDSLGIKTKWYTQALYRNYLKLKTGHLTSEEFRHKTLKTFSSAMFFLMPLVAFYLLIFHRKLKMYYSEHLVFSIHIHSLAFLVISIWLILKPFLAGSWLYFVFLPGFLIYIVLSIKTVYQQKIITVIVKFVSLVLLYIVTFIVFSYFVLILSLY